MNSNHRSVVFHVLLVDPQCSTSTWYQRVQKGIDIKTCMIILFTFVYNLY